MTHFSTDSYPEKHRFEAWQDEVASKFINYETARLPNDTSEFRQGLTAFPNMGGVVFACFEGSSVSASRRQHHLADGNDDLCLRLNRKGRMHMSYRSALGGKESHRIAFNTMGSALTTSARIGEGIFDSPAPELGQLFVYSFPRKMLLAAVPHADALLLRGQGQSPALLRFLVRYTEDLLLQSPHQAQLPWTTIGSHLFDLVAMLLGPSKDAAHTAQMGGLRAARFQGIVDFIDANYLRPDISAATAGRHLGITARYVQKLLEERAQSFTALVNARRLDEAQRRLTAQDQPKLSISETAYACGFNDLSYFNRTFKQRFHETPRTVRNLATLGRT